MAVFEQTELRLTAELAREKAKVAWDVMQARQEGCEPPSLDS